MKVFISHSHADKSFALAFSEFLASIGFERSAIFCSSIPGQGVGSEEINKRVLEEIATADIIFLIISDDYSKSEYCLNEMGATWILNRVKSIPYYCIKLPNISFDDIRGFINANTKQYTLDLRDIKLLTEDLLIKIDRKMSNSQIDNTSENFIEITRTLIVPGSKDVIEYIIRESDWDFEPSSEYPNEQKYIKESAPLVVHEPYIHVIKFESYNKDLITKIRIFKKNWTGIKDTWFTCLEFNYYNIDDNKNILLTETQRRDWKIQIW